MDASNKLSRMNLIFPPKSGIFFSFLFTKGNTKNGMSRNEKVTMPNMAIDILSNTFRYLSKKSGYFLVAVSIILQVSIGDDGYKSHAMKEQ